MSFEEMQSILQGILLSQQQMQHSQEQFQHSQEQLQLSQQQMQHSQEQLQLSQQQMQHSQEQLQLSQQEFRADMVEIRALVNSNSQAIQAMLDQAATDRLENQERARRHEEEMRDLKAISRGLVNLAVSIDEDRPTILRLLNSNDNKLDAILDRLPPQQ
jgi:hypothetical protein